MIFEGLIYIKKTIPVKVQFDVPATATINEIDQAGIKIANAQLDAIVPTDGHIPEKVHCQYHINNNIYWRENK